MSQPSNPTGPSQVAAEITLTFPRGPRIAVITIDRPKKLNAVTQQHYFRIAELLLEIAKMEQVMVTVVTGKGRFFSAGADVSISRPNPEALEEPRRHWLQNFAANNIHNPRAWYTHPKILITALNGPAVGLSAAITAHSDFIYAAPHAYLLTPFSSLGLVAEGAASVAFVRRLGIAKANEALVMSKRITAEELVQCGYVNAVFSEGGSGAGKDGKGFDSEKFLERVLAEVEDRITGGHLVDESLLGIKKLVQKGFAGGTDELDRASVEEAMEGMDRFMRGVPQREFERIASGEKRHKL